MKIECKKLYLLLVLSGLILPLIVTSPGQAFEATPTPAAADTVTPTPTPSPDQTIINLTAEIGELNGPTPKTKIIELLDQPEQFKLWPNQTHPQAIEENGQNYIAYTCRQWVEQGMVQTLPEPFAQPTADLWNFVDLHCRTLYLLSLTTPPTQSFLPGSLTDVIFQLPANLPGLDKKGAQSPDATIQEQLEQNQNLVLDLYPPHSVELKAVYGIGDKPGCLCLSLTELARADFNQDGLADLLLRSHVYDSQGTFKQQSLLLFTRRGLNQPIQKLAEAELLSGQGSTPPTTPAVASIAPEPPPTLEWRTYTTADGLTGNQVQTIAVDSAGRKWFGTEAGVTIFDGENWTTYTQADGLVNTQVTAIAFDSAGHAWIGTSEGISELGLSGDEGFDGQNWTNYTTNTGVIPDHYIHTITIDAAGQKWFGTNGGLTRFDGDTWITYTSADGLIYDGVTALAIDPAGHIWSGGKAGVSEFDGQNWTTYNEVDGLSLKFVRAIAVDPNGHLWVGTDGGLFRFNDQHWVAIPFLANINDLAVDQNGHMWAATNRGVVKIAGQVRTFYTLQTVPTNENYVQALVFDPAGHLWVGTLNGVSELVLPTSAALPPYELSAIEVMPYDQTTNTFLKFDELDFWNELDLSLLVTVQISGQAGSFSADRQVEIAVYAGDNLILERTANLGILAESTGFYYVPAWLYGPFCRPITIKASLLGQSSPSTLERHLEFNCGE